ncbi:MAG: 3-hydroxyacyl-ACP dehydratase FabZ [Bacteroidales bacterium]|nr:3-hydroxyacyl-ACP dehydratase FabZ [Bacteroidales bacterium]
MNREELKAILPHREPMLLLDESSQAGDTTYSKYTVRGDEYFLQGHFPGKPIVPGVILCEIMAQASSLLMSDLMSRSIPLYAGIDQVRFKRVVVPGDTVEVKAHLTDRRGNIFFVDAEAIVGGQMCCRGKLTFMLVEKEPSE